MNKPRDVAKPPPGYLLREENVEKLEQIRGQLFLMARMVFAATLAEEHEPLEIQRSMLGQCFENFGRQLDEVLSTMEWAGQRMSRARRRH
ncbi:XAC0095 family protein [Dyella flava]|uniref:XAC0095-like domain-containing protein n=1 Tax=Dyella flava TaxID=1920170 RepID=A0ABS2K0F6_9GAMM|nr:hypothetical protein [Dyella flava]MBM7124075.1 hypothetical protein [Dyella flava]GLQ49212.1 hypothetical protein GCM10010872_06610 [Dyella flava]